MIYEIELFLIKNEELIDKKNDLKSRLENYLCQSKSDALWLGSREIFRERSGRGLFN